MKFALAALISACIAVAQGTPGNGSIEGRVLNSLNGAPVRKAIVTLTLNIPQLTVEADAEGRFRFEALPAGTYRLKASHAGFLDHGARRPLTLAPGDHFSGAEIRLPPQGVIAGHVFDEDGDPVSGTNVTIFRRSYVDGRKQWNFDARPDSLVITNDSGEFRFPNLPAGQYLIKAQDHRPELIGKFGERSTMINASAYYPGVPTEDAATPVNVRAGAEERGVDIRLRRVPRPTLFHVSGKVIGAPPGVSSVSLSFGGDSGGYANASPPEYIFQTSLAAGQYQLTAQSYPDDSSFFGRATVIVSGDVSGITVAMSAAPEVGGRIVVTEGASQSSFQGKGVTLGLKTSNGYFSSSDWRFQADSSGNFDVVKRLRPARYGIAGSALPDNCYRQALKFGNQEVLPDDFEILSSGQLEVIVNCTAGAIVGSATDDDGKPFAGSIITLIPEDAKSRPAKQIAADGGVFKFTGLMPGKYKLYAWEQVDDGDWQDPDFLKKYQSTEVTVGPNQTQSVQLRVIFSD